MDTDKKKNRSDFHLCSSVFICGLFLFVFHISGCDQSHSQQEVVLYTSVDEPYARPIVQAFEKETDIKVRLVTDTEATKSVGLAERLRAEKANPQADVWWGNEPFHTINLAEEGLLAPYESSSAEAVQQKFKDYEKRWTGNGLRARVVAAYDRDDSSAKIDIEDLAEKGRTNRLAMARPTAGTTGGHVSALYVLWGEEKFEKFFTSLRFKNMKLLGGNAVVAEQVGRGQFDYGLTDNDDVQAAQREGGHLSAILPDQSSTGTLAIPTTVGLVAGAKHPDLAKKLIDHLLSAKVEQQLIDAKFAGWSVRESKDQPKWMDIDYREVARAMPQAVRKATAIIEGRE